MKEDLKNVENPASLFCGQSNKLEPLLRQLAVSQVEERCAQIFLDTRDYHDVSRSMPLIMANLHLFALPAFLKAHDYEVLGSIGEFENFSGNFSVSPPSMRIIATSPNSHASILEDGNVFIENKQGQRAILRVRTSRRGDEISVTLRSRELSLERFFTEWQTFTGHHAYLRNQRFHGDGRFLTLESGLRVQDVELPDEIRAVVTRTLLGFTQHLEQLARLKLPRKRGVLLAGPPGTGKSMLCRALANEIEATFIWLTPRQHDRSAENLADIWALARMLQPTVIVIEDVDFLGEARSTSNRQGILGELLNQMDGAEQNDGILTIATTNYPESLDEALSHRPGRFDKLIKMSLPNEQGRRRILERHMADWPHGERIALELAKRTEGLTAARLVELLISIIESRCYELEADIPVSADVRKGMLDAICGFIPDSSAAGKYFASIRS